MSDRDCSSITVLGAFVLGGVIGAGIALLTAPRSGRELRGQLGTWAEGATERTRDRVSHLAQETGDRVRHVTQETGQRLREGISSARERMGRGQGGGEQDPDESLGEPLDS
jgi:gas vesicle protein